MHAGIHRTVAGLAVLLAGLALAQELPRFARDERMVQRQADRKAAGLPLDRYDLDGDGVLSPQERLLAVRDPGRGKADERGAATTTADERVREVQQFTRLLAHFDKDGDARLSATERAELVATYVRELDRHDANGDGLLAQNEWMAARTAWRERYDAAGGL